MEKDIFQGKIYKKTDTKMFSLKLPLEVIQFINNMAKKYKMTKKGFILYALDKFYELEKELENEKHTN